MVADVLFFSELVEMGYSSQELMEVRPDDLVEPQPRERYPDDSAQAYVLARIDGRWLLGFTVDKTATVDSQAPSAASRKGGGQVCGPGSPYRAGRDACSVAPASAPAAG
jgi:hypothetical protein